MFETDQSKIRSQMSSQGTALRKVVAGLFISLDGVVEAPDQWQFDVFDEDMVDALSAHLAAVDTTLLGRVTYQQWAEYWPTAKDEPYASHINNTPKYVFSTTLKQVNWQNATLVKKPLAEEILRLKQQPGKNIEVAGSPGLVHSMFQSDLLDELILMIHPVVVGRGKRLFQNGDELKRLKLVHSKITGSGVIIATYRPMEQAG